MHGHTLQLLQKHHVLLVNVRSVKFLHNKSCGFFPVRFSPQFLPSSIPIVDGGQRKGDNRKKPNDKKN